MNGIERIAALFANEPADRVGFWLGNPTPESKEIYKKAFGIQPHQGSWGQAFCDIDLHKKLNSDFYWCSPELDANTYQHPEKKPMWDPLGGKTRTSLGQPGVFAPCEDVEQIHEFEWPNPDFLDFSSAMETAHYAQSQGLALVGGMWMPYFHILCDFFGMENYFVKMHTHPEVVEAATEKILEFYLEANKRCLETMGHLLEAVFFGNDLGSQQTLLAGPDTLKRYVFPGMIKIIQQAKNFHKKIMLHSCGAVSQIIPWLIEAGIDALHPLQAKAKGMDADTLAKAFKGDLLFVGGVDTQELLPFGDPEEIKKEVKRLIRLFGARYIVSPSHEALLPNVSPEKVICMMETAVANYS